MKRYDVINNIIRKENYVTYLEIGYGTGLNYDKIRIKDKTGIDIGHGVEDKTKCFIGTASSYFNINSDKLFDIIFIDGSHLFEDVLEDIYLSLDHISDNGTIVLHDCNPPNSQFQERQQVPGCPGWTGDVWKAIHYLKKRRKDLYIYVVDTDYGCGVIRKHNKKYNHAATTMFVKMTFLQKIYLRIISVFYSYSKLANNRKSLLGLITTDEFLALCE